MKRLIVLILFFLLMIPISVEASTINLTMTLSKKELYVGDTMDIKIKFSEPVYGYTIGLTVWESNFIYVSSTSDSCRFIKSSSLECFKGTNHVNSITEFTVTVKAIKSGNPRFQATGMSPDSTPHNPISYPVFIKVDNHLETADRVNNTYLQQVTVKDKEVPVKPKPDTELESNNQDSSINDTNQQKDNNSSTNNTNQQNDNKSSTNTNQQNNNKSSTNNTNQQNNNNSTTNKEPQENNNDIKELETGINDNQQDEQIKKEENSVLKPQKDYDKKENSNHWLLISIVSITVLVFVITIIVIIINKKKGNNKKSK